MDKQMRLHNLFVYSVNMGLILKSWIGRNKERAYYI